MRDSCDKIVKPPVKNLDRVDQIKHVKEWLEKSRNHNTIPYDFSGTVKTSTGTVGKEVGTVQFAYLVIYER